MNLQPFFRIILLVLLLGPIPDVPLLAQDRAAGCPAGIAPILSLTGAGSERLRLAELSGELAHTSRAFQTSRTLMTSRCADSTGVIEVGPAYLRTISNTGYALDRNDALLWGGRGFNGLASAGMRSRWGRLRLAIAPQVAWHENRDFRIQDGPATAPFRNPWHPIDWPQRFGLSSFTEIHPGESYARLDAEWVEIALASESLWWGPAARYPLLISNTGPGFPHLSIATPRPLWIGIGDLEAQIFWGRLRESDYFDVRPENDHRVLSGLTFAYRPAFLDGLYVGIGSLLHQHPSNPFTAGDLLGILDVITLRGTNNIPGNGLVTLFFRWIEPESELEVFGEYGRNDYALDLEDLLGEPDHSRAYNLGLRKAVPLGGGRLRLATEVVHLQASVATWFRLPSSWYESSDGSQGHTHRGQMLGAFVGPGSDAQYISVDWFGEDRSMGIFVERIRWDDDAYQENRSRFYGFHGHDIEVLVGVRHSQAWGDFFVDGELLGGFRRNRNFLVLDGVNWEMPWEENVRLDLSLGWTPRARAERTSNPAHQDGGG